MPRKKRGSPPGDAESDLMRDQEVIRANRELAAYFKGRRTEREARAALKTIKAFVRDRERQDAKTRAPLPGAAPAKAPAVDRGPTSKTSRRRPRAAAAAPTGRDAVLLHAVAPGIPDPASE